MRFLVLMLSTLLLASCGTSRQQASADVATTVDPFVFQNAAPMAASADYRIGAADKLRVTVFQVPDLSFAEIPVDTSGNLQMPLIGAIRAAGRTPSELSAEIEGLLGQRYLRNPQVTVTVTQAASQKVTVDGAVVKPGVYEMRGRTTLLQAVAMAEGASKEANVGSVAIFRTMNGQRMLAVFDLRAIRNGQAEDVVIQGDDVIVVDTSRLNSTLREVVAALPGLAVFAYM